MKTSLTTDGREVTLYEVTDYRECPMCGAHAVVPLTASQLGQQPDETTHVCHPALGGCNHGFTIRDGGY